MRIHSHATVKSSLVVCMTTKYYRSPVTEFQTCIEIFFRDAKFTRYP
jgi:hypothetical protein